VKAVAVYPGRAGSIHLEDLPAPAVADVPNGRGVLVEVLRVGVDGQGDKRRRVRRVLEGGPHVRDIEPRDYVVATVRRPGTSIYDRIGYDMTTDETYYERGINLRHGALTERGVMDTAEAQYPGWLERLSTHPVDGLENYEEMARLLTEEKNAIKVYGRL
jgi:glucose 1-dehydrogenase